MTGGIQLCEVWRRQVADRGVALVTAAVFPRQLGQLAGGLMIIFMCPENRLVLKQEPPPGSDRSSESASLQEERKETYRYFFIFNFTFKNANSSIFIKHICY